jgi:chromosome segregation ATPase
LGQIWTEAWRDASKLFDAERKALAGERSALEREKNEMEKEIERLETALTTASEELHDLKAINTAIKETVATTQTKLAKEEAAAQVLKNDLREVKEELKEVRADLTSWIQRGTKAESALTSAQGAGERKGR